MGSTHNCKDGSIIHVSLELGQQRSMVNVPVNFHCKHCMTVKEDDTVTNVYEMDHPVACSVIVSIQVLSFEILSCHRGGIPSFHLLKVFL